MLARLLLSPFVKIRVVGAEVTRRRGPFVLASNHISHFDPPLIGTMARRKIDWMAMLELFEIPVVSAWLRAIDSFPVDRVRVDRTAVRTALARLHKGHVVGMFPEGGIRDGVRSVLQGAPLLPGVGALVQLSGGPVIPCVILGSDRLYARKAWLPLRRVTIWIAFGPPMWCAGAGKSARKDLEAALGVAIRQLYEELIARFSLLPSDLPQPPSRRKGRS